MDELSLCSLSAVWEASMSWVMDGIFLLAIVAFVVSSASMVVCYLLPFDESNRRSERRVPDDAVKPVGWTAVDVRRLVCVVVMYAWKWSGLTLLCITTVYVALNKWWLNSTERALLQFLESSVEGDRKPLSLVLPRHGKMNAYLCVLGPYQTALRKESIEAEKEINEKVNAELLQSGYRRGILGSLRMEGRWVFVLVGEAGMELREISRMKVPFESPLGDRDCFRFENVAVENAMLTRYPYRVGLKLIETK